MTNSIRYSKGEDGRLRVPQNSTPESKGFKSVSAVNSFEEYAKKFYNLKPSKHQLKVIQHIINGDTFIVYTPNRWGKSNFDKMTAEYIKHMQGNDLVATDPDNHTDAVKSAQEPPSNRRIK